MSKRYIITLSSSGNIQNSIDENAKDIKLGNYEENMSRKIEESINNKSISSEGKLVCAAPSNASTRNEQIKSDQKI